MPPASRRSLVYIPRQKVNDPSKLVGIREARRGGPEAAPALAEPLCADGAGRERHEARHDEQALHAADYFLSTVFGSAALRSALADPFDSDL